MWENSHKFQVAGFQVHCRAVTEEEVELRVLTVSSEDENKKPAGPTLKEFSNSGQKGSVDQFLKVLDVMPKKDFDEGPPLGDEKAIGGNSCSQSADREDEIDVRADQMGEQTSGEECRVRVHPEYIVAYPAEDQERQVDSGSDKEMEMERVLEQQAELIDQYEAEENAQREWEKKFRELSSSSEQSMVNYGDSLFTAFLIYNLTGASSYFKLAYLVVRCTLFLYHLFQIPCFGGSR
jgi:hypothetical protein